MWIGIDDTDSRNGGCTTHLAGVIISSLQESGVQLIGLPRLVRLNPTVPWKTRGNGSVSFQIGRGAGAPIRIGRINDIEIVSYPTCSKEQNLALKKELVEDIFLKNINRLARLSDENTNPGLVFVSDQIDEKIYWRAVRKIIDKKEIISLIRQYNGQFYEFKNGRGIIGATAGIAWRGNHDHTFELIAYREQKKWGTKRFVDDLSIQVMDKRFPSTFDNYDRINDHVNVVPNSPCPVLFGIRSDDCDVLPGAMHSLKAESFNDWLIFSSNQGTDDHLQWREIKNIQPYESIILSGIVKTKPNAISGGHVIFSISDENNQSMDCAAYEPTKEFRDIIRQLEPGDSVKVFGGVRKKPFTVNLEKIQILHLKKVFKKVENPVCPNCGKHMKSSGRNQGFRCKKCKTKAKKAVIKEKKRGIRETWYEVPVCARRHLSKPLRRMKCF